MPTAESSASFASDCLLITSLIVALGIPLTRSMGVRPSPALMVLYVCCAAAVPCVVAGVVWRVRWRSADTRAVGSVVLWAAAGAAPAIALVGLLYILDGLLSLVGIGMMTFAAGVAVAATSAVFRYDTGSARMVPVRLACIALTPAVILGAAGTIPQCTGAVQCWAIPVVIAGSAALGARRALLYHVRDRKVYGEDLHA